MKYTTSILKRPTRDKKTSRVDADGKSKTIKIKGGWYYRIRFVDNDGISASVERGPFSQKNEARDARDTKLRELESSCGNITTGERMTFDMLADICEREFYKPIVMSGREKVSGVKSHVSAKAIIRNLREFFGRTTVNSITSQTINRYKEHRVKQSVRSAKSEEAKAHKVKLSTAHRELTVMRRMMRHAHNEGWVLKNIFANVKIRDTDARDRILSREEEVRLLASCQGERKVPYTRTRKSGKVEELTATITADNPLLKAIITVAIDSGLRRGEILQLRWKDIDLVNNVIRVDAANSKTNKQRFAPLSDRIKEELEKIRLLAGEDKIFPISWIGRSFGTAIRLAGLGDLRFHDLRRTFITRQAMAGGNALLVGKLAGHSELTTTLRHYTSIGPDEMQQVNAQINADNLAAKVLESSSINLINSEMQTIS